MRMAMLQKPYIAHLKYNIRSSVWKARKICIGSLSKIIGQIVLLIGSTSWRLGGMSNGKIVKRNLNDGCEAAEISATVITIAKMDQLIDLPL